MGEGGAGWGREGRQAEEGGDICIIMAVSPCSSAETNTTCKAIFLQLKNKLKNDSSLLFFNTVPLKVLWEEPGSDLRSYSYFHF